MHIDSYLLEEIVQWPIVNNALKHSLATMYVILHVNTSLLEEFAHWASQFMDHGRNSRSCQADTGKLRV